MAGSLSVKHVGVVGAGLIGASWAAYFLSRGLDVSATDPGPDAEKRLREVVGKAWPTLEVLGTVPGSSPDRLSFDADLPAALEGVDFVQESGPEREPIKIALFSRIDEALDPNVVVASSSSGLLITNLQAKCANPERFVLGHPFNPPHLIPLVEVVGGKRTAAWAINTAMQFYRDIGKWPIRLNKEVKSHVANRLQGALWREAASLVADGVCSVADVDAAIAKGPGLRWAIMGPLLTLHLGGGEGGLRYWFDNISKLQPGDAVGSTVMSANLVDMLVKGVEEEAGDRSVAELASERDEKLIAMFRAIGIGPQAT
jgi:carnitine 3-dehydrogenase